MSKIKKFALFVVLGTFTVSLGIYIGYQHANSNFEFHKNYESIQASSGALNVLDKRGENELRWFLETDIELNAGLRRAYLEQQSAFSKFLSQLLSENDKATKVKFYKLAKQYLEAKDQNSDIQKVIADLSWLIQNDY